MNRLNDISYLRVFAMLLVVFGHCICPYSIWHDPGYTAGFQVDIWEVSIASISQIHVPLFFLIAGFLFGYKRILGGYSNRSQFVKNKIDRILIPYIFVGIFMCLIQRRPLWEMCLGVSHLWFLMTIFECYVAGYLLEQVLWYKESMKFVLVAICCIILVVTVHWNLPTRFFTIERFVHYFPLYLIGMLFGSSSVKRYVRYKKRMIFLLLGAIVVLPIQHICLHKVMLDQFVGLLVILPLFFLCRSHYFANPSKWIISLDKHSMSIYILHQILQQEMNKVAEFHHLMISYVYMYPLCQFVLLVLICWLISHFAHRSPYAKYIIG